MDTALPRVIGLYSPVMQSGKTTAARWLAKHFDYQIVSFATPLKDMVCVLLQNAGLTDHEVRRHLQGDLKEQRVPGIGLTPRRLMQTLGSDWGRQIVSPTLWVDVARAKIESLLAHGERVVIDDMRFENEYDMIRQFVGGQVWKVIRPSAITVEKTDTEGRLEGTLQWDRTLFNTGSLDLYHATLESVMSDYVVTAD